jgi:hypothetical protein
MNAVLDAKDTEIHAAEDAIADRVETLRAAAALRDQLEGERRRASGRMMAGDPAAGPDLDRLLQDYLAARRAAQDADVAVHAAQERLLALQTERRQAESQVTAEHLAAVLDVRSALAAAVEAQATELAGVIRLYLAAGAETVDLAKLLGAPVSHPTMVPFVARRIRTLLNPALPQEGFSINTLEKPLPVSDADVTTGMRGYLERERTRP